MHQSRVYALLIDTPEAEAAPAASFWSAALGATARPVAQEPQFTLLHQALPGLVTYVQAVDDAPRFHLDIETDNVEAETSGRDRHAGEHPLQRAELPCAHRPDRGLGDVE